MRLFAPSCRLAFCFFLLLLTAVTARAQISPPIYPAQILPLLYQESFDSLILPDHRNVYELNVPESALIAEATLFLQLYHENIEGLQILLIPPKGGSISLLRAGEGKGMQNPLTLRFDDQNKSKQGILKPLSGINAQGVWKIQVEYNRDLRVGTFISAALEIAPANLASLHISDGTQQLSIDVDPYGAFGDQGYRAESNLGAKYQAPGEILAQSTVFHSALFSHAQGRFLTSIDMLPGSRMETAGFTQIDEQSASSRFRLGELTADLHQSLRDEGEGQFALMQDFTFTADRFLPSPFILTRYINPKFNDIDGHKNYVMLHEREDRPQGLYVFDEIANATTDESRFVAIAFEHGNLYDYTISNWILANAVRNFADNLLSQSLLFYTGIKPIILDNNGDGVTDPQRGFDVALAQAVVPEQIVWTKQARFTAITRWGFSSPSKILSATAAEEPTPTPTIESEITPAPTDTATPIPTLTPTLSATFSPTPISPPSATPTGPRVSAAPEFIAELPDLRVLVNEETLNLLDLDDYIADVDTPAAELRWSLEKPASLPLWIDEEHQLNIGPIDQAGLSSEVRVWVTDGQHAVSQTLLVKASTMLVRAFRPLPPIRLAEGESSYTSPYRLNDLIVSESESLEDTVLFWQAAQPLPPGIVHVEIHGDSSFTLYANESLPREVVDLRFAVRRRAVSPIPTAIPTMTPTATPLPSPTAVATVTPLGTAIPPATFTPTPTPTFACASQFNWSLSQRLVTGLSPIKWRYVLEERSLYVAEADSATLGVYRREENRWQRVISLPGSLGVADMAFADLDGDGVNDLIALNPWDEQLLFYKGLGQREYAAVEIAVLANERIPTYEDASEQAEYTVLLAGDYIPGGAAEIVLRLFDALLILAREDGGWVEKLRLPLDGRTRSIFGQDLDSDGDIDLLLALRTPERGERVLVLRNDAGAFTETASLTIDRAFNGNYAKQMILAEVTGDRYLDLLVLDFDDSIQVYEGQPGLQYAYRGDLRLFPPGEVKSIALGDLNRDGIQEIFALHFSLSGLTLYNSCGDFSSLRFGTVPLPVDDSAISGQNFDLQAVDIDDDGQLELLFSRSIQDDLLIYENSHE